MSVSPYTDGGSSSSGRNAGTETQAAEEAIEEAIQDVSDEVSKPKMLPIPYQPTAAQIEEHEMLGHVQYRSWCRHCVAARAIGQQHKKVEHVESEEPEIACDYAYMRSDTDKQDISNSLPMLVIKDSKTKMYGATFVSEKGLDAYAVKYFTSFIQGLGYKKIIIKSDGEHSIVALKERQRESQELRPSQKKRLEETTRRMEWLSRQCERSRHRCV